MGGMMLWDAEKARKQEIEGYGIERADLDEDSGWREALDAVASFPFLFSFL
jgi:hypothetical protein